MKMTSLGHFRLTHVDCRTSKRSFWSWLDVSHRTGDPGGPYIGCQVLQEINRHQTRLDWKIRCLFLRRYVVVLCARPYPPKPILLEIPFCTPSRCARVVKGPDLNSRSNAAFESGSVDLNNPLWRHAQVQILSAANVAH